MLCFQGNSGICDNTLMWPPDTLSVDKLTKNQNVLLCPLSCPVTSCSCVWKHLSSDQSLLPFSTERTNRAAGPAVSKQIRGSRSSTLWSTLKDPTLSVSKLLLVLLSSIERINLSRVTEAHIFSVLYPDTLTCQRWEGSQRCTPPPIARCLTWWYWSFGIGRTSLNDTRKFTCLLASSDAKAIQRCQPASVSILLALMLKRMAIGLAWRSVCSEIVF